MGRRRGWFLAVIVLGVAITAALSVSVPQAIADSGKPQLKDPSRLMWTGPSIIIPVIDSARGRQLFAAKGCVICHAINGVGGGGGPDLNARPDGEPANPFDFAARMFRGAEMMIALQKRELGYQIELNGRDLADIIGFVYDRSEQHKFSEADIPDGVRQMMRELDL